MEMDEVVVVKRKEDFSWTPILRTANLYLSFFGLGLCCAIPGPTLLDLQRNVGTDTKLITFIYASRSTGTVVGSILGGILFDYFNRQILFVLFILGSSVVTFAIPWWSQLAPLAIFMLISGISLGAIDTGSNVWCLDIWRDKSGPYMQALHFTFGLGAFVAPLVAEPFLSPLSRVAEDEFLNLNESLNSTLLLNSTSHPEEDGFFIINAYAIISGYVCLVAISFLAVYLYEREDVPRHTVNSEHESVTSTPYKYAVLSLATLFLTLFCGVEITYGQMLTTFAVKSDLRLSKSTGSFMTSVYWGTYTFARGLGIIWATRFSALSMLVVDLILINLACILLALFGNTTVEILWAATAILGLGVASLYASLFAWIERYVQLSNKVASIFVVAGSIGEMLMPAIVGYFTDVYPAILLYACCGISLTCTLVFAILCKIASIGRNKYSVRKNDEKKAADAVEEIPLNSKENGVVT